MKKIEKSKVRDKFLTLASLNEQIAKHRRNVRGREIAFVTAMYINSSEELMSAQKEYHKAKDQLDALTVMRNKLFNMKECN